jgi:phosphoribosylglycinamide formyltransferase-1
MKKIRLAIFVSGNGTNCENLIRHFQGSQTIEIALVLSNRADAYALERARRLGVRTVVMGRQEFNDPDSILPLLRESGIDFIVLAGFLLFIPGFLIDAYPHRMVNLHPALLPKFGGKGMWGRHVHEAVKAAGETATGMTVHWVSREVDGGEIIAQYRTPILPTDSVDDIAEKEHQLEMRYFPEVIERVVKSAF